MCYTDFMDTHLALRLYLQNLEVVENKSMQTISGYRSDLEHYVFYLQKKEIQETSAVSSAEIEQFLMEYAADHETSSSNRLLSALRSFHAFVCLNENSIHNPAATIQGLQPKKHLPIYCSKADLQKLFASFTNSDKDLLDRAMLLTLYSCGLRVSELCSLKLNDVHFYQRQLKVLGKGEKERLVPLNEVCIQAMQVYLDLCRPRSSSPLFFLHKNGKVINRQYVHRLIKNKCESLNLDPSLSAHSFRHSFATSLLDGGADLRIVQELLGHSDIRTTQIYTHVQTERLKRVYDQAMPELNTGGK